MRIVVLGLIAAAAVLIFPQVFRAAFSVLASLFGWTIKLLLVFCAAMVVLGLGLYLYG